jgi:hypothetical protein
MSETADFWCPVAVQKFVSTNEKPATAGMAGQVLISSLFTPSTESRRGSYNQIQEISL